MTKFEAWSKKSTEIESERVLETGKLRSSTRTHRESLLIQEEEPTKKGSTEWKENWADSGIVKRGWADWAKDENEVEDVVLKSG